MREGGRGRRGREERKRESVGCGHSSAGKSSSLWTRATATHVCTGREDESIVLVCDLRNILLQYLWRAGEEQTSDCGTQYLVTITSPTIFVSVTSQNVFARTPNGSLCLSR